MTLGAVVTAAACLMALNFEQPLPIPTVELGNGYEKTTKVFWYGFPLGFLSITESRLTRSEQNHPPENTQEYYVSTLALSANVVAWMFCLVTVFVVCERFVRRCASKVLRPAEGVDGQSVGGPRPTTLQG
jgi:hypothetical protein